jgi:hypothetical protein
MGLDITAYSHLKHIGPCYDRFEEDHDESHILTYAYTSFPDSFRGLGGFTEADDYESFSFTGETCFMGGHCYAPTPQTEKHRFHAGSYSGYSIWRARLATFAWQDAPNSDILRDRFWDNIMQHRGKPFYELINFADNEGCIGPVAADKLFDEFTTYRDEFRAWVKANPELKFKHVQENTLTSYDNWMRAFDLASYNGLVRFH